MFSSPPPEPVADNAEDAETIRMKRARRRSSDIPPDRGHPTKTEKRPWLAKTAFVLFCLETIFSIPYRSVYLFNHSVLHARIASLCVLAVIGVCFAFRRPILQMLARLLRVPSIGNAAWFFFWLVTGLVLRLAWMLRFPATIKSDHLTYFQVAAYMAEKHAAGGAFWPPGFSLFLAPIFMIFGPHRWVTEVCALLFFVATYAVTYALANRIRGGLTSRVAPMLIAIWPGYLMLAGINCKEGLLAVLVPAAVLLYLKAFDYRFIDTSGLDHRSEPGTKEIQPRWGFVIAAGLCMGFATLTQPGYILFPLVILGIEMLLGKSITRAVVRTAVFSIAILVAVLPWTFRNYRIFHRVVLISTNGGSVFYRANNPLANANYTAEGEVPLPKDEFVADRMGYRLAEDWIVHHPDAFTVLMVKKQIVFLGDDSLGPYETLKRDLNPSTALYGSTKGVSNLFWLMVWTVLLLGFPLLFRFGDWRLWYGALFLPLLYQWAIDSVFESGPRHHVPYLAFISVLAATVLHSATRETQAPPLA